MQTIRWQFGHLLATERAVGNLTRGIALNAFGHPNPEAPFVSRQPPLLRRVRVRDTGRGGLEAGATGARGARIRRRWRREDAVLSRRPAAHVLARIRVAARGARGREAAVELTDAVDVLLGEGLRVVVHVGPVEQGQGAGLGEGVVAVQHDAVEIEGAAVRADGVLAVVVAEFGRELAGPAAAAVARSGAAALCVGLSGRQAEWIVGEV